MSGKNNMKDQRIKDGIQEVVMPTLNTQDPKWLESWKFSVY
jgi:hypothetical protein